MKLKPLHDWIVIVPVEAATRTAGGLYIPDSAKEKPEEGIVEAVGPGASEEQQTGKKKTAEEERKFIPTTVKPGDRVLFERWSGRTHTIGKEERILVRERDILGIIERPLQIPQATGTGSVTAIVPREAGLPAKKGAEEKLLKTPVKTAAKKKASAKKAAAKTKKAAKKKAVKASKKSPARAGASKAGKKRKAKKKK